MTNDLTWQRLRQLTLTLTDIDMTHWHEKNNMKLLHFQLSLNDDDDGYAHECP